MFRPSSIDPSLTVPTVAASAPRSVRGYINRAAKAVPAAVPMAEPEGLPLAYETQDGLILFAGGSFLQIFPLRGLTSENFESLSLWGKAVDYAWHLVLPLSALVLGAFATSTLLTKNSFLDEIRKQYVVTARMKGVSERRVLYGHVFRNAMLIDRVGARYRGGLERPALP